VLHSSPATDSRLSRAAAVALGLLSIAFAAVVYWPITRNYFLFDDFLHLYEVVNLPLLRVLVEPFGEHLYVVRNLVFASFYHVFGPEPRWFFAAVLLTHLVNVGLLYLLVWRLTRAPRLACAGAAVWGTAPVLEGALGWYSAYGQVLVATVMLAVLADLVRAADSSSRISRHRLAAWSLALVAGATCHGTGIGVALGFPVIAFLLLPPGRERPRALLALAPLWALVPSLYLLCRWTSITMYPGSRGKLEMQLALARAWRGPLEMLAGLLAQGVASVHLGFRWLGPEESPAALWLVCGLYLGFVVAALAHGTSRLRRRLLACLLLSLAIYSVVAAGRGSLQILADSDPGSTVTAFGLGATTRYHYAGVLPLLLASCLVVGAIAERRPLPARVRDALLVAALGALVFGYRDTAWRIDEASSALARKQTTDVLNRLHARIRAAPPGRNVYFVARRFPGVGPLVPAARFPGWAAVFAIFFPDDRVDGHRVFFVSSNPEVLGAARGGKRSQGLLVSLDALPQSEVQLVPLDETREDSPR
jgi:hypothetical protein